LFSEQFAFRHHALVNFVGGGGKTSLIYKLLQEYCSEGPVLSSTTTRIHPPDPNEGLVVISGDNLSLLKQIVTQVGCNCSDRPYKMLVTRYFMSPNLLRGVPSNFADSLDRKLFAIFFNEADGAASFSLKLPREGEPVLMNSAEYLVPVIGMDCLFQPMGPDVIFRWQVLSERFSLRCGEPITPELAAGILMHTQGVCKDWKPGVTIIPFINKVDDVAQDSVAKDLAHAILHHGGFPVDRVVLGSIFNGRAYSVS
jgi:probable selenium-dependent hydroxylase accessory protein YqeC